MAAVGYKDWAARILHQGTPFVEDEGAVTAFSQYFRNNETEIPLFLAALSQQWQAQQNWLYLSVSTILICGGQPNVVYEQLRAAGLVKTGVCTHVWKPGDNAYRCRTCELDTLAVICMACFEKGNHKDLLASNQSPELCYYALVVAIFNTDALNSTEHNYMLVGASGGCCDCGDEDAWKAGGCCPDHTGFPESDPSLLLPADIRNRAHIVIRYWLSLIAKHISLIFETDTLRDFVAWLTRLLAIGDGFRRIINEELFAAPGVEGTENLLEALFMKDSELSEKTSTELHHFYYAIWVDKGFKQKFFISYARCYPKIISALLQTPQDEEMDEGEADTKLALLEDLSVQMFTVHSLLVWATREGSIIPMLLECCERVLAHAKPSTEAAERLKASGVAPGDEIDLQHHIVTARQYSRTIRDLRYALSNTYSSNRFVYTDAHFKRYLSVMVKIQALQKYVRIVEGRHIEFENDSWIGGWELELHFLYNSRALQQGFRAGESLVALAEIPPGVTPPPPGSPSANLVPYINLIFNTTLPTLLLWWLSSQKISVAKLAEDNRYLRVVSEAEDKGVSFHIPIHRTYAYFIESVVKQFGVSVDNVFSLLDQHGEAVAYSLPGLLSADRAPRTPTVLALEHVLRVQGLIAEVGAGMWRRNGVEMWAQSVAYRSVHCSELMLDTDIFFMQCAVITLGASQFIAQALASFGLAKYFKFESEKGAEFHEEQQRVVAEEFLRLTIALATDRSRIGFTEEELIRRELVHRLCAGDKSYSELSRNIPRPLVSHAKFDAILKDVSTYQLPQGMEQGSYQLKPACWLEWDRYFTHYDTSAVQAAEERYAQARKNSATGLTADHLATPVTRKPLLPAFARITSLLHSELLMRLLFSILHNAALESPRASDSMLAMALYLLRQSLESVEAPKGDLPATGISEVSVKNPAIWDLRVPADMSPLVIVRHRFTGLTANNNAPLTMLSLLLKLKSRSDPHSAEHKPTVERILALLEEKDPISRKLMTEIRELSGASPAKVSDVERKRLARERQNAILAKFASQQKAFKGSGVFENMGEEDDSGTGTGVSDGTLSKEEQEKRSEEERRKLMPQCALCKEHTNSLVASPIALVAFAQPSAVLHETNVYANKVAHPRVAVPETKPLPLRVKKDITPASSPVDLPLLARHRRYGAEMGDEDDEENEDDDDDQQESENVIGEEEEDDDVERAATYMENLLWGQVEGLPAPPPEFMEGDDGGDDDGDDGDDNDGEDGEDMADGFRFHVGEDMPDLEDEDDDDDDDDDEDGGTVRIGRGASNVLMRGVSRDQQQVTQNLLQSILTNINNNNTQRPAAAGGSPVSGSTPAAGGGSPQASAAMPISAADLLHVLGGAGGLSDLMEEKAPQPLTQLVQDSEDEGVHLLFCGHQIHMECFDRYFSSLIKSHIDGNEYEGDNIINLELLEFLCPVCRRLSNTLVPLVPDSHVGPALQPPAVITTTPPEFDEWFRATVQMFSQLPAAPKEHKPRFLPAATPLDNAIDSFVTRTESVAEGVGHESVTPDEDATPYMWNALAYTIASYEQAVRQQRDEPAPPPLLAVPEMVLSQWLAVYRVGLSHRRAQPPALNRPLHLDLLRNLLAGVQRAELENASILTADSFSSLVRLVFLWPRAVTATELRHITRLQWLVLLLQIAVDLGTRNSEPDITNSVPALQCRTLDSVNALEQLVAFCKALVLKEIDVATIPFPVARPPQPVVLATSTLAQAMRAHAVPFLRCTALFVRTFTALHNPASVSHPVPTLDTYEELITYLGLPPLEAVLMSMSPSQCWVALAWLKQVQVADLHQTAPALAYRLIDLPNLYTQVVSEYMSSVCGECGRATNLNALCLICGAVVCAEGCTQQHAAQHADVGIFLLINTTSVVLIRGDRVGQWGSPYLDEHGEEDIELRRGKPLHLNAARYAQLRRLWVTQGIEHDSHVLAKSSLQGGADFLD